MVTTTNQKNYKYLSEYLSRNLWSGFLFGLGQVGFIDETILDMNKVPLEC